MTTKTLRNRLYSKCCLYQSDRTHLNAVLQSPQSVRAVTEIVTVYCSSLFLVSKESRKLSIWERSGSLHDRTEGHLARPALPASLLQAPVTFITRAFRERETWALTGQRDLGNRNDKRRRDLASKIGSNPVRLGKASAVVHYRQQ